MTCGLCGTYAGTIPHMADRAPLCDPCARVVTVDDLCTECGQRVTVAQFVREPVWHEDTQRWEDGAGHARCLPGPVRRPA